MICWNNTIQEFMALQQRISGVVAKDLRGHAKAASPFIRAFVSRTDH